MAAGLATWNEGAARRSIVDFVDRVTRSGSADFVEPEGRIAVFDNDGTLWSEKPMPVELGFILERLAEMAAADPSLRARQPWQAALARDTKWLGSVIVKHYRGDDSDVKVLLTGILQAFSDMTVEEYGTRSAAYLASAVHPTLGRKLTACVYAPMVDLLRYLESHGFTNYIASGGDRDFMRMICGSIYGLPPERVIGSSNALRYREDAQGGSVVYQAQPDVFDDGAAKPVRIWSRIGRRPLIAVGNSNGDIPMLRFAGGARQPALRLLLTHDDEREFVYTAGAEESMDRAAAEGWTVVSMRQDWTTVFGPAEV